MADGKSKSEEVEAKLLLLVEAVVVTDDVSNALFVFIHKVEVIKVRSCGIAKPWAAEDHDRNKSNANWRLFVDGEFMVVN